MFRNNDKFTLTITNFLDLDGNVLPGNIKMPINGEISIPKETVQVMVFEYQEGNVMDGSLAFNIYIGEIRTISSLADDRNNNYFVFSVNKNVDIKSIESPVCTKKTNTGKVVVFATVTENDIVVKNLDELKEKLYEISDSFLQVKEATSKVKKLKYKNK